MLEALGSPDGQPGGHAAKDVGQNDLLWTENALKHADKERDLCRAARADHCIDLAHRFSRASECVEQAGFDLPGVFVDERFKLGTAESLLDLETLSTQTNWAEMPFREGDLGSFGSRAAPFSFL